MRLLDHMTVTGPGHSGRVELYVGDLAAIPDQLAVDALVVSAFPGSYHPTRGTLIEALHKRGLSVANLAADKAIDLRDSSSCWLSHPVPDAYMFGFQYLVCFEPLLSEIPTPALAVGDLFRTLVPLSTGEPWIRSVAMPLLATGNQRESRHLMLESMISAASHWLSTGLSLDTIRIVLYHDNDESTLDELTAIFRREADKTMRILEHAGARTSSEQEYDVFVSYSRADERSVDDLIARIGAIDPAIRVYVDRRELDAGTAWQQAIFEAIDSSRFVLCLYSPEYLASKVCNEEFHIGMMRHRNEGDVLIPAYLRSTSLRSYMQLIQYTDVREADPDRIEKLARTIVDRVRQPPTDRSRPTSRSQPKSWLNDDSISLETLLGRLATEGEINLDIRIRLRERE